MSRSSIDQVDYDALDQAKLRFIEASRQTLGFAARYGFVPDGTLGASANVFSLDLAPFFKAGADRLHLSLVPEGLGTADDARPDDLSPLEETRFWHNIAFKTLSCLSNDAASAGLQTILIGLYLPSSTPETVFSKPFLDGFLGGIVEACRQVGCVYISGETPQLKTKITPHKLDIAGALFGLLPRGIEPLGANLPEAGDQIVLLSSSGPQENGFTPLRKFAESLPLGYRTRLPSGTQLWEAMNAPSVLYTPLVQALLREGIRPSGLENITGHGWQKIMRSRRPLRYRIEKLPPVLEVFEFVQRQMGLSHETMLKTFNCGAGFAVFLKSQSDVERSLEIAQGLGIGATLAGRIEASPRREVAIEPAGVCLDDAAFVLAKA